MKKRTQHNPHGFIANIFGSIGYVALLFIWLIIIELIVVRLNMTDSIVVLGQFSSNLIPTVVDDPESPFISDVALRYLMYVALAILSWYLAFFASRLISAVLKGLLVRARIIVTPSLLLTIKFTLLSVGLFVATILIVLLPAFLADVQIANALLAAVAGLTGYTAFFTQHLVGRRHKLTLDQLH